MEDQIFSFVKIKHVHTFSCIFYVVHDLYIRYMFLYFLHVLTIYCNFMHFTMLFLHFPSQGDVGIISGSAIPNLENLHLETSVEQVLEMIFQAESEATAQHLEVR